MRVLVISDNGFLVDQIQKMVAKPEFRDFSFTYRCSPGKNSQHSDPDFSAAFSPLHVRNNTQWILDNFSLVISAHCKQIFPDELVEKVRCINVHPGLNPYNRGWFPQVFSIINGMPAGATIHEIDKQLDHGPIIAQQEVLLESHDTSLTAYQKIQRAEVDLLHEFLLSILNNDYEKKPAASEGNINLKKDFNALCHLDLQNVDTFENHIKKLRALTHGSYQNAYFLDENGKQIFISLNIQPKID